MQGWTRWGNEATRVSGIGVPVETVFDQGIGDVFVARVAGYIENEDMLGSF
jgi:carbonic anhydrase